jgi:sec-independent protein translocase protein TatC
MSREVYLTFTEHLEDLRWCLIRALAVVLIGFVASYFFSHRIFAFMVAPLRSVLEPGQSLIGTGVTEAFFTEIKVAFVAGIFVASPAIFHQVWRFIAPGLRANEKKLVVPFVLASSLFFIGGAFFCYQAVLPLAFSYFIDQFRVMGVSPEIRIGEYFTFFFRLVLAFGITFELPVLTFFMVRVGIWDHRFLLRQFRYAILVIFILAAVLTPGPDVISQVMLAVPLTVLYGVSIGVAYFWRRDR